MVDLFSDPGSIPGASIPKQSSTMQRRPEMGAADRFPSRNYVHTGALRIFLCLAGDSLPDASLYSLTSGTETLDDPATTSGRPRWLPGPLLTRALRPAVVLLNAPRDDIY